MQLAVAARWPGPHGAFRAPAVPLCQTVAKWFELRTPVGSDTFTVNVSRVGLMPDASTGELCLDEPGPYYTCPNNAFLCGVYCHHGAAGAPRMKSVAAMKVSSTHGSCRCPVAAHNFW